MGRLFYESGPQQGLKRLAAFLDKATARGELAVDDPVMAANMFIALCQNRLLKGRLCNYMPEPSEAQLELEVAKAVDVFLKAFAV